MVDYLLKYGLYFATYLLELTLFVFVIARGRLRQFSNVASYSLLLLAIDGAGRSYFLYHYGLRSTQYLYFYFVTDALLVLAAYLVVCSLFRCVCHEQKELWSYLKMTLIMVFLLLVVGIMWISWRGNRAVLSGFIIPFEQYLYFACLVLNTLLYILSQRTEHTNDQVDLLICGLGIYFAAPAATWALLHLASHRSFAVAESLVDYMSPLCTLGMLGTWFYAVARLPKSKEESNLGAA